MAVINSYKDLQIWQRSIKLVAEIYTLTSTMPEKEKFGLITQLNRAAVSVSANIAEGWGRASKNSYSQFLKIARGSLYELETLLIICKEIKIADDEKVKTLLIETDEICKMLNAFIRSINKTKEEAMTKSIKN
jgi:four helix bundle protein